MGSDHELTEEQFEGLADELQELADDADVELSAEDHSTNEGGDYYFIFKDDVPMELESFVSFVEEILSTLNTCLKPEADDWWISFE